MKSSLDILGKGWLTVILLFFCSVTYSQSIRYSGFYDLNNGAGGLLSVVRLGGDSIMAVGSSLNLTTNSGYSEGHHVVVGTDGSFLSEHIHSEQEKSHKPQTVMVSDFSGSIYSAGYHCDYTVESPGPCDLYISKLNHIGDTIFTKIIERPDTTDFLLSMVQTTSNSILLVGRIYYAQNEVASDVLITAVDTLGNVRNNVVYGGGSTDFLSDGVAIDSTGDAIMVGFTRSFPSLGSARSWVIKTDSLGNVKWHRNYIGIGANQASGIRASRLVNGNIIISGGKNGDGYLQEVDTAGNEIWIKLYDVTGGQGLWGVEQLEDGSIVSCGVTDGPSGSQAGWLIKTDENGDTLWTRTYDESIGTDYLRNMMVMDNGDIVMVGFGRGENSLSQDGWILRVDSMGCVVENCHLVGIEEASVEDDLLSIYPNPATSVITIGLAAKRPKKMELVINDQLGSEVFRQTLNTNKQHIEVSNWARGVYHCGLYGNQQLLQTEKLILMK